MNATHAQPGHRCQTALLLASAFFLLGQPALAAPAATPTPTPPPSTQVAEAERLFSQGREHLKAKRYAEACAAFEASHQLDPGLGTLLNLADCNEKLGRVAQAYQRFSQAAEWARSKGEAKREQVALERGRALKPKVSWLNIRAPDGATVTLDGLPVTLANGAYDAPVEPGAHQLTATFLDAPPWSATFVIPVGPGSTLAQVPPPGRTPLAQASPTGAGSGLAPHTAQLPSLGASPQGTLQQESPGPSRTVSLAMAAGGATLLAAGAVGILYSFSVNDRVQRQQVGGPDFENPTVTRSQYEALRFIYPLSWAAVGLGTASMGASTYFLLKPSPAASAPSLRREPEWAVGVSFGGPLSLFP